MPSHWSRVGARLPNTIRPIFLIVQNRNLSILIKKQRPIISSAAFTFQFSILNLLGGSEFDDADGVLREG